MFKEGSSAALQASSEIQDSESASSASYWSPGKDTGSRVICSIGSWIATQDMLRDTARGGAGTNPMMSYITDAAPQQGEATMRAGRHAEVSAAALA